MCGIVAIVTREPADLEKRIAAMNETLIHRGPDDSGIAVLREAGAALAMRRLTIVDPEGGRQPLWNEDATVCVVFNGEIYNAADLRTELQAAGHRFHTDHSDTEVLVHGHEEWGDGLFERLNGMFAFALWDGRARQLVVARDRAGEKPLYVGRTRDGYAVASELKALLRLPALSREIDPVALEQYLAFDYVLGPRTILRDVEKLPAGHYGTVAADRYRHAPYWSFRFAPRPRPEAELIDELDALLDRSVRLRMVADVPVGLFLSGGLDSSTIGFYMRRHGDQVRSFSIGFDEAGWDESAYARLAAATLGTHHRTEILSQGQLLELIPRISEVLDEPMGDESIFPTLFLSLFTRRHVKVALGGDGSDELLMGYRAYQALKVAGQLDRLPLGLRHAAAAVARGMRARGGSTWARGIRFARRLDLSPSQRLLSHLGSFKGDARWVLAPEIRLALPRSVFDEPDRVLLVDTAVDGSAASESVATYLRGYLQEDILVKVDRASMAASLEVRAPFLDPELIDFLLTVPPEVKLRRLTRKYLLRRLMRGRLPDTIIDRPKMGFGVPLSAWLRRSLAPLVRERLAPDVVDADGLFDPAAVAALVDDHLEGRTERGRELWLLLQFQLWKDAWLR